MTTKTKRWLWIVATTAVIAILAVLYYIFDPGTSHLAPKCPMKLLTGFDCPSCGIQRAFHSLLHGDIVQAILINPFIWLCLPYLVLVVYAAVFHTPRSQRVAHYVFHHYTLYTYIALYFIWWVVRNTPLWLNFVDKWV